jgi:hypothetical protein
MLPSATNAQAGLLRRAINKKLEHKIDSAVDKSDKDNAKQKEQTDQNSADKTSAQENGGTKATGRGLFGGKIDIKYNDEYNFTGRMYMQMESYEKKDVMKTDFYTYFNTGTRNAGIETSTKDPKEPDKTISTVFLYDYDNRCFLMLIGNADSKTGIISTMPSDSAIAAMGKNKKGSAADKSADQKMDAGKKPTITKTGNSRVIAGYKCDEFKVVEPDVEGYSDIWMTKDFKIQADKNYWNKAGMPSYYGYPEFEGAVMLAMESYDKNNSPKVKMETKEINEKVDHSISTKGYTFMKMNFGQAGKK